MGTRPLQLDGCFSYWDDCLVLLALLCQELGLPCSRPTPCAWPEAEEPHPAAPVARGPLTRPPSMPCPAVHWRVRLMWTGLSAVLQSVMKLEFRAGAVGVRLVKDASQCREHFSPDRPRLAGEADHRALGWAGGNAMLLMEFIGGRGT